MSSPIPGADFIEIDGSSSPDHFEDDKSWEMVMEPISQVTNALEAIKNVCAMSNRVCVNKHQCKRIADRFGAVGGGLKGLRFDGGNASDRQKDYPAFDELLTVLRKGEALVSSYVESKGISSVISRTDNREAFKEIHEELDTLKAQFDFESFSEPGQVKDFESSSVYGRTYVLAEDAERDLKEMPAQLKYSEGVDDIEKVTQVVLEKSGVFDASTNPLPSYLAIDPAAIKIDIPVRPMVTDSKHDKQEEVGWAVVRFGTWLGCGFAVKVFKSEAGWNKKQLEMEVGSLEELRHPHIVRLVGFGQDSEKCVFLMELMDADLRNFMKKKLEAFPRPKPRPFQRCEELDIITQIAKGMYYMHTQQYAHGDLKCSNILVKNFGQYLEVKIADLRGSQKLGKVWDAEAFKQASLTRRPRWTAPEAIAHYNWEVPPRELLKKSDVYSFGMTCYEVVTGKYPFDGIKDDELLKQIKAGVRPELPGDLDEDLKGLIKLCWDEDPSKRPGFGDITHILDYIRSKKPVVVSSRLFSKSMALSLMKAQGVFAALLGLVRQGKERQAMDTSEHHESSVWGVMGEAGLQRSDSALSVPEYLRIQPDKLNKVRRIGKGASAVVYEATWLGCTFAVKVFLTRSAIHVLQREVDFLIKLSRHPCIAQMVGLSVDANQQCSIVMEFVDGNLQELIAARMRKRRMETGLVEVVPFDLHEAVPIITKIALGMAFLHSKGVMHRDLKSGNVLAKEHVNMIDVKLVDFGMSHHEYVADAESEIQDYHYYVGVGTGFWRAPEVLPTADRTTKPDLKAADVYSFAMTCFEVLTGKAPFSDLNRTEYARVINGERPSLPAHLHPGLKALIEQCWDAEPAKRPTFSQICEELQNIQQTLRISVP